MSSFGYTLPRDGRNAEERRLNFDNSQRSSINTNSLDDFRPAFQNQNSIKKKSFKIGSETILTSNQKNSEPKNPPHPQPLVIREKTAPFGRERTAFFSLLGYKTIKDDKKSSKQIAKPSKMAEADSSTSNKAAVEEKNATEQMNKAREKKAIEQRDADEEKKATEERKSTEAVETEKLTEIKPEQMGNMDYEIKIKTSTKRKMTIGDGLLSLRMFGTDAELLDLELESAHSNSFKTNNLDTFNMKMLKNVGKLEKISLKLEGNSKSVEWKFKYVRIVFDNNIYK